MAENNIGNADPRYEGDASIAPIQKNEGSGATAENPGNVHPPVDPHPDPNPPKQEGASMFHSIENPYALKESLGKLESAIDEIIGLFQGERDTLAKDGSFSKGKEAIAKFQSWKEDLESMKQSKM